MHCVWNGTCIWKIRCQGRIRETFVGFCRLFCRLLAPNDPFLTRAAVSNFPYFSTLLGAVRIGQNGFRDSPKPLLRVRILLPLPRVRALKPLSFKALLMFWQDSELTRCDKLLLKIDEFFWLFQTFFAKRTVKGLSQKNGCNQRQNQ